MDLIYHCLLFGRTRKSIQKQLPLCFFGLKDYKLVFALICVAFVWGTTFLGIRIAVESIPGWYVAGFRQLLASLVIFFLLLYRRKLRWIGWRNTSYQIILSLLMLVVANGLVTLAEESINSSLASLLNATIPILVFVGSLVIGLEKFRIRALCGILLCLSGILFIFWNNIKELADPNYKNGIILMFCAVLGWASGILFSKKIAFKTNNISLNLFYQFAFSAIVQLAIAYFFYDDFSPENWTTKSVLAIIYLAIFGSIITFFAFHYALSKITPIQVSILSYINTIIAIFLGWLILDEPISLKFIVATILIISGVFITNYKPKKQRI